VTVVRKIRDECTGEYLRSVIRSAVGNRGGIQYIVVNAAARRHAGAKAGDVVTIVIGPDTEKRDIEIPIQWKYSDPSRRVHSNEFTATGH
jgi:hypothetical protein